MSEKSNGSKTCLRSEESHQRDLQQKITDAKHLSKPDAKNAIVVRSASGRWLFEIYTVGHTVDAPGNKVPMDAIEQHR